MDRTGLTGYYQITLTFAADLAADAGDAPTLFTAMQKQLALKLEPSRAAADARDRSRRWPVGAVNKNERDSVPLATCEARRCQPEDLPNRQ